MKTKEPRPITESACPTCGTVLRFGRPSQPVEGQLSDYKCVVGLCNVCGEALSLDRDMKIRLATIDDMAEIVSDPIASSEFDSHQIRIRERRARS
jgi:hypothetical protein